MATATAPRGSRACCNRESATALSLIHPRFRGLRRGGEEGVGDLRHPVPGGLVDDLDGQLQGCHLGLLGQLHELAGGLCGAALQTFHEDALGEFDQGASLGLRLRRPHLAAQPLDGGGQPADGRRGRGGPVGGGPVVGRVRGGFGTNRGRGGRGRCLSFAGIVRLLGDAHGAKAPRPSGAGARKRGRGPGRRERRAGVGGLMRATSVGRRRSGPGCRRAW